MHYIPGSCTNVTELMNSVFPRMISTVASLTYRDTKWRLHTSEKHHWFVSTMLSTFYYIICDVWVHNHCPISVTAVFMYEMQCTYLIEYSPHRKLFRKKIDTEHNCMEQSLSQETNSFSVIFPALCETWRMLNTNAGDIVVTYYAYTKKEIRTCLMLHLVVALP
jgi:dipeptide/tripeptide permease